MLSVLSLLVAGALPVQLSPQSEAVAGCALRPALEAALARRLPEARLVEDGAALTVSLIAEPPAGRVLEVRQAQALLARRALPTDERDCAHLAETVAVVLERARGGLAEPPELLPSLSAAVEPPVRFVLSVAPGALLAPAAATGALDVELALLLRGRARLALGALVALERTLDVVHDGEALGRLHSVPVWGYASGGLCTRDQPVVLCGALTLGVRAESVWASGALQKLAQRWLVLPTAGASLRAAVGLPGGFELALSPLLGIPLGTAGGFVGGTQARVETPAFEAAATLALGRRIP